eukprot:TRINITY_DN135_c0_g1_i11.p1 TRINITY_DN135_c0_g1~~TRINITY_DN135_c0_g1_i11.p1  ORF type:complete len:674 (+),score=283.02 TRINITY_DN135_c0_g1_i11:137-2158(+)
MSSSSSSSSSSSAPGLAPPLSVSGVSVSDGVQPEKKSDVKLSADPKNVAIEWVKSRPVITVSVVVFLSWFLGYMGYFVVWVMWLVPLSLAWERLAVQRLLRRETRRVRQEILSSDFVRPEFETAAWINQLFENCWINYGPFAAQQIEENTRKAFSEKKPPIFSDMALESINMGAIGPKVYNVYVHKTEPHILKIEADVVLDSTLSMEFVAKLAAPPQPKVPIAIRDAFVSGRFCFEMEMLPGPPFTKQIKFCFLGDPEIDVKVKPLKGLDLLSIPGLHQAVRDLVRDQINAQMVAPNVLTVILDKSSPPPPSPSPAPLDRSSSSKGLVGSGIDGIGNAGKAVVGGCANVVGGAADLGKNVVGGAADLGKNVVGGAADLGKNVVGGAADLGKNVVGGVFGAPKKLFGSKKKKDSALSSASSSCEDLTRSDPSLSSDVPEEGEASDSERSEREEKPKEEKEKKGVVAGISGAGKSVADGAANVVGGAADLGKNVVGGVFGAPKKLFGSKKKAKTDSDSDPDLSSHTDSHADSEDHKDLKHEEHKEHKDHKEEKVHKEKAQKESKSLDKNPSIKDLKASLPEDPKDHDKGVVAGIGSAGKSVVSGVFNSPKKLFGSKKKAKTDSDSDPDLSSHADSHPDSEDHKEKSTRTTRKRRPTRRRPTRSPRVWTRTPASRT